MQNKCHIRVIFEPKDLYWTRVRNERFPGQRKSKLQQRGDGLFQVLEKINVNAYKSDLPREYNNISVTFNVVDLSLFDVGNGANSKMNPLEEGGNDKGATNPSNDPLHGIRGPMISSKTKRMKQTLQGIILKIKKKEDQCELGVATNWVTSYKLVKLL